MKIINQNYIQKRFDSSTNSTKFYDILGKSSLSYKIKMKYSKVKWLEIPINIRFKIMYGMR